MNNKKIINLLLATSLLMLCSCFTCSWYYKNKVKPKEYNGTIINIYEDEVGCFAYLVVTNKTNNDTLSICYCDHNNLWEYMEIGDSLIKEQGSVYLKVIKKVDGDSMSAEYPCCDW
jgi:hypothetical protein